MELFLVGMLLASLVISGANLYFFFEKRKHNKQVMTDEIVRQKFILLRKELKLLEAKLSLLQEQAAYDASRIESIEKLVSALLAAPGGPLGGGNMGGPDTLH